MINPVDTTVWTFLDLLLFDSIWTSRDLDMNLDPILELVCWLHEIWNRMELD